MITDDLGAVVTTRDYTPFGDMEGHEWVDPLSQPESKAFIGERFDPETGLVYLHARYYDPKLGLFTQGDWWDPTEPGVGTNRYMYSFGDPVNLSDRNGHVAGIDDLAFGLALGVGIVAGVTLGDVFGDDIADALADFGDAISDALGLANETSEEDTSPGIGHNNPPGDPDNGERGLTEDEVDDFSAAGTAEKKGGFTAAGHSAQKHDPNNPRGGSFPAPPATNPRDYNELVNWPPFRPDTWA